MASCGLSGGRYQLTAGGATAVAAALIDDANNYSALILHLEDFARHQQPWRIPLGLENYAEGVDHRFYATYVNNNTGALSAMTLGIQRNTGAQATVSLQIQGSGAFDSGTSLTIFGEA